ncbi:MAG TPA: cupin domain-containing protein [Herpetosiphonaceae bacterium]
MHPRARQLITQLGLQPHPEGGHYREIWRSPLAVRPGAGEPKSAITTIYVLLAAGEQSRWHRVAGADEIWHFYEGAPLELHMLAPDLVSYQPAALGPAEGSARPAQIVPADYWQAARSTGDYTLAGCSVGPGFEFADFDLLADLPAQAAEVRRRFPLLAPLI